MESPSPYRRDAFLGGLLSTPCPLAPNSQVLGNGDPTIGVRIERGIDLLPQFGIGKQLRSMFDEFLSLDQAVSIVVHSLSDCLGLIRNDPVQEVFGSGDDAIGVVVGGSKNACPAPGRIVSTVVDELLLGVLPV